MRLRELDGIRGLAAAEVMASHLLEASRVDFPGAQLLMRLTDAATPVILFFVLSGLCLSLPFFNESKLNVADFYCRRVCRIYPAFLVSLAVALLALAVFPHLIAAAADDAKSWGTLKIVSAWGGWNAATIARYAALIYPLTDYRSVLNHGAVWSLVIEMRISIVLPAVILAVLWIRSRSRLIGATALLLLAQLVPPSFSQVWLTVLWNQLFWVTIFLVGVAAAKHLPEITAALSRAPKAVPIALAGASAAAYFLAALVIGTDAYTRFSAVAAVASLGLMAAALSWRALGSWLISPLPQFLGRVSYSLYLLHGPFYTFAHEAMIPRIGLPAATAIYVAATIYAAYLSARFVEEPFIRIGSMVGGWTRARVSAAAPARPSAAP